MCSLIRVLDDANLKAEFVVCVLTRSEFVILATSAVTSVDFRGMVCPRWQYDFMFTFIFPGSVEV